MVINFSDGSFISFIPDVDKITLVVCGKKNKNETTMSSSILTKEHINDIMSFLANWSSKEDKL